MRWQFDLSGGLNPAKEHFAYILVAIDQFGEMFPHIIPSWWAIGRGQNVAITSHPTKYRGWIRNGLEAWYHIPRIIEKRRIYQAPKQLSLFDLVPA